MFNKVLILTIFSTFLAIVTAQQMDSAIAPPRPKKENVTKCYSCDNPISCRKPKKTVCDRNWADETLIALEDYFSDVANITTSQFECLNMRYSIKDKVQLAISGCVNVGLNPCSLELTTTSFANATKVCETCSKDLCNPAGTVSSSLFILLYVMLGSLLLKSLKI